MPASVVSLPLPSPSAVSAANPAPGSPSGRGLPSTGRDLPLSVQLPRGRLIELTGDRAGAHFTSAVACLRYAQSLGETTAWVQPQRGPLFPPDLADSGIDLASLVVVHVPRSAGAYGLPKAAELLLRSGGFGMLVVDLTLTPVRRDTAWQGRLLGLAREHDAWLLLLTERSEQTHDSLGPLVNLQLQPQRVRQTAGVFTVTPQVLKNKSGSLGPLAGELRRGPWGLV